MRLVLGVGKKKHHHELLVDMAKRDSTFERQLSRLEAFRALRNSIVHTPSDDTEELEYIAEPLDSAVDKYRKLVDYLKDPPTALDTIATRDVYSATWNTSLAEGLGYILDRGYDTIPIKESDNLEGIYTLQCLQRMFARSMAETKDFVLSNSACFGDIKNECEFSKDNLKNENNKSLLVRFAEQDAGIEFIEDLFKREAQEMNFLAAVCITPTSHAFEPLLGLITPHNLPSANASANEVLRKKLGF